MARYIDADKLIKDIEELPNCYNGFSDTYDKACIIGVIDEQSTVEPTLYGYNLRHLALIAEVLQKEGCSPEDVVNVLNDIGRVVKMCVDEMTEKLNDMMQGAEYGQIH